MEKPSSQRFKPFAKIFFTVVVILLIVVSLIVVTNILILIYVRITPEELPVSESNSFPHVVTEYSRHSNKTKRSIAYLPKQLSPLEYVEYDDESGMHFLVSNFLEALFMCHGVCYCIDEKGMGVSEKMVHMVPAGSFLEAYEIVAEVTPSLCSEVFAADGVKCSTKPQGEFQSCIYSEGYGEKFNENSKFMCEGDCVVSKDITDQFRKRAKDVCNGLWLEGIQVRLDCKELSPEVCSQRAHETFVTAFLIPFCTEVPHVSLRFAKDEITSVFKTVPLCEIDMKPKCLKLE